jgi:phage shock protein A
MVYAQIERLKKDSNELDIYAKKLLKRGQESRAQKILQKRDFIQKHLSQLTDIPQPANSS